MDEQFVPGDYSAIDTMYIRNQRKTSPGQNIVGGFSNGEQFKVYEVYPEVDGIVWGRVSSATGEGMARYVGMRVNNHPKVRLERVFEQEAKGETGELIRAISANTDAITLLATAVRELARKAK